MDEPSAGDVLNEGIMKQMVGGDEMEGREMYGRHMIKFYPQFELVCCTNRIPSTATAGCYISPSAKRTCVAGGRCRCCGK